MTSYAAANGGHPRDSPRDASKRPPICWCPGFHGWASETDNFRRLVPRGVSPCPLGIIHPTGATLMSRATCCGVFSSRPEPARDSLVLFTCWRWRPSDSFSELATNPNVPPEVAAEPPRASSVSMIQSYVRYLHWIIGHGARGLGLLLRKPGQRRHAHSATRARKLCSSSARRQLLALAIAIPVGVYAATRPYSIFDQIANTLALSAFLCRPFYRPAVYPDVFDHARLAAFRLHTDI